MAERRMFAKTIIDSDAFLDMSPSAQALYFHLGMRADDEGFVNNCKKIQRMTGASDDDLKILMAKKFVIPFDSGIVVIKHWCIHNYIRSDRLQETKYQREKQMLVLNKNESYTLLPSSETPELPEPSKTIRQAAYENSSLPYSFDYKIRQAFYGKNCPVCGATMETDREFGGRDRIPSIQHNTPISQGGEHELGNISVICKKCNVSIKDTPTDSINADEVAEIWEQVSMSGKCQADDGQKTGKCQHRLGKVSIGNKESVCEEEVEAKPKALVFQKPTVEDVAAYCKERKNTVDAVAFMAHYDSNGWLVGKAKMKDWKATVVTWERMDFGHKEPGRQKPIKEATNALDDIDFGR